VTAIKILESESSLSKINKDFTKGRQTKLKDKLSKKLKGNPVSMHFQIRI